MNLCVARTLQSVKHTTVIMVLSYLYIIWISQDPEARCVNPPPIYRQRKQGSSLKSHMLPHHSIEGFMIFVRVRKR